MPKRPPPGPCTYCLQPSPQLTWDHVLPLGWYPESTPEDIEKWKVPACLSCNHDLGKIEEDLLLRLGLCLEPNSIASLGIAHKTLRSLRPEYAKSERDRRIRERKREKLLGEAVHFESPPQEGLMPHFGPLPWLSYAGYHAVLIDEPHLRRYAQKLVRGMALVIDGGLLGTEYRIELHVIREEGEKEIRPLFLEKGSVYHRRLGFIVRRLTTEDERAWLYSFLIWERLSFYASVHPEPFAPVENHEPAA